SVVYGAGFLKLNPNGDLLWDNLNTNSKVARIKNFEILSDESVINQYSSTIDTFDADIIDSHLYKINPSGQTIWQVDSLSQDNTDVSIDELQNSYESAYNDSEFYLLKYDLSGHQLWKKVLFDDLYFY